MYTPKFLGMRWRAQNVPNLAPKMDRKRSIVKKNVKKKSRSQFFYGWIEFCAQKTSQKHIFRVQRPPVVDFL